MRGSDTKCGEYKNYGWNLRSDEYKRGYFLVRKNGKKWWKIGEKWGNIRMRIMLKMSEYKNKN